ncbi:hypothetical protein KR222_008519, partial [Zaprionus bogoriensis]
VDLTVLHPAHNIGIRMQVQRKANGYKPWIIDATVDGCKYMKYPKTNKIVKIIFDLFSDFSNINHTCPFVGRQIVKDFYPIADRLLLPLPTGDYALFITWLFDQRVQFVTNIYFTFVEN